MTEIDEARLTDEFTAYRQGLIPAVHPAGPDIVRVTVRRRRRRAAVLTAAAVVLAVAIPIGANAALHGRSGPPPGPADTTDPTPSVTATPTPTPSPAPTTASPMPAAPDGRISRAELLDTRLDLPAWSWYVPKTCTTAGVRLRVGPISDSLPVLLGEPKYGDVDGDGAEETVVLLGCRRTDTEAKQVVVFDRDASGRITAMGPVVGTHDELGDITDFTIEPDGAVRVAVANLQLCCEMPLSMLREQSRTYAWTGDGFRQTAGPTAFPTSPPPSTSPTSATPVTITWTISATELVYGPPDATGMRRGTTTVTIVNTGNGTAEYPLIIFPRNGVDEAAHGDWAGCPRAEGTPQAVTCIPAPLRTGERRTIAFPFLTTASKPSGEATVQVAAGTGEGVKLLPGSTPQATTFAVSFGGT